MLTELRRAGELHAGRPNNADNVAAFLSGFGISQHQSSRWQRLSSVPEESFRAWLEQMTASGAEVTEVGLTGVAASHHEFASSRRARRMIGAAEAPKVDG
jgi:hypothetical protein